MCKLLVVLSACLCVGYAATAIGPLEPKPKEFKDQEGCYVDELKALIPVGESRPSKIHCEDIICVDAFVDNNGFHATLVEQKGCPDVVVLSDTFCKLVIDEEKKPYPYCCPRVECP